MTRKDYELIAASIHRSQMAKSMIKNAKEREAALAGVQLVAVDICASIANREPRFDKLKFLNACGYRH